MSTTRYLSCALAIFAALLLISPVKAELIVDDFSLDSNLLSLDGPFPESDSHAQVGVFGEIAGSMRTLDFELGVGSPASGTPSLARIKFATLSVNSAPTHTTVATLTYDFASDLDLSGETAFGFLMFADETATDDLDISLTLTDSDADTHTETLNGVSPGLIQFLFSDFTTGNPLLDLNMISQLVLEIDGTNEVGSDYVITTPLQAPPPIPEPMSVLIWSTLAGGGAFTLYLRHRKQRRMNGAQA